MPITCWWRALGGDPASDAERFEAALTRALEIGLISDAAIGKSQAQRDAMWAIRDDVEQLLNFKTPVPVRREPEHQAYGGLCGAPWRMRWLPRWPAHRLYVFGHLGDGNLHVAIHTGTADGDVRQEVEELVYQPLQPIGGSVLSRTRHWPGKRRPICIWLAARRSWPSCAV